MNGVGTLDWISVLDRPDLLAAPVAAALANAPREQGAPSVLVAEIDPGLADTAAFCAAYEVRLEISANCVVLAAKRSGATQLAACLVLATTRADVNGVARRRLEARKASFAAMDVAVALPPGWPLLVDAAVAGTDRVIVGSGLRRSKLLLPGEVVASLPGAAVVEGLGVPTPG
jgi:prolyl-tRNA editing enzyme YbaK/EbsC (Cys-tRNA(Pro) deacylase)